MIYHFGDFELDTDRFELRHDGSPCAIEPQVFDLLRHLIEARDQVVTRDELLEAVWSGRIVSDSTLSSRVKAARKAIGDSGEQQKWIQTAHGRGFRFIDIVDVLSPVGPRAGEAQQEKAGADSPELRQDIRYCKTKDGVRIAFARLGEGSMSREGRQLDVPP